MPEPPVPGKGPFMRLGPLAALPQPIPADSPKWCGPWDTAGSGTFRAQQGSRAGARSGSRGGSPALLLKTDGGNAWLEARGLHASAARAQGRPGQGGAKGAQEDLGERGVPSEEEAFTTDKEGPGVPAVRLLAGARAQGGRLWLVAGCKGQRARPGGWGGGGVGEGPRAGAGVLLCCPLAMAGPGVQRMLC